MKKVNKDELKTEAKNVIQFIDDHKWLISLGITFTGIVIRCITSKTARRTARIEREVKDLMVYDKHAGHYWKLRKPISSKEWLVIENELKAGKWLGEILSERKLLK